MINKKLIIACAYFLLISGCKCSHTDETKNESEIPIEYKQHHEKNNTVPNEGQDSKKNINSEDEVFEERSDQPNFDRDDTSLDSQDEEHFPEGFSDIEATEDESEYDIRDNEYDEE